MDPFTSDGTMPAANDELAAQLPRLYELARSLDVDAADDLVQETVTSALTNPVGDATGSDLAAVLTRLADIGGPVLDSPVVPEPGSDPDADEAELFYPGFYTDGPDAGAWVDPPIAWGEARVLRPEEDLATTEAYGIVEAVLADLDPIDASLVTLVDLEGMALSAAARETDLPPDEVRERLARGRSAVRTALDRYLRS